MSDSRPEPATALDATGSQRTVHRLEVDLRTPVKAVDRAASGSLYGLAGADRPADALVAPLRPKMFTQMAPAGGQLPNGETSPAGDVLDVAAIAARHGASVTVRMPDSFPTFPYRWTDWADWLHRVRGQVLAVQKSGVANIYAYELWNEPNWTWDTESAGPFPAGWKRTFDEVRSLDGQTPIMGPSIDRWHAGWMSEFLTAAVASASVPDIVSWHELDPADSFELVEHVAAYRRLEESLGIEPRRISLNEYGAHRDMADPGALTRFIAMIERSGVDTANLAFWHRPGRLADLVTAAGEPTGAWWLYRWYGELTGSMVAAEPAHAGPDNADVFASLDPHSRTARIVVGGGTGDAVVRVLGAGAVAGSGGRVHVEVRATTWTGPDGALAEPPVLFTAVHDAVAGVISVPLRDVRADDALLLTLTPAADATSAAVGPRYEAEHAALSGGTVGLADLASGGRYVELPAGEIATFAVSVPTAGAYDVWLRSACADGIFGTTRLDVTVPAGASDITVGQFSQPVLIDHIDITPFRRRWEAEDGWITRGSVERVDMRRSAFRSNKFSGAGFVSWLNEVDSAVELDVAVPADGRYAAVIGYTNGTGNDARQRLLVDGVEAAIVTYPPTQGPELVGTVRVFLHLGAGSHVLRLEKQTLPGHVSLDFVEIADGNGTA